MFPEDLDYERSEPLAPTWHRIDASVRTSDKPFDVEEKVGPGAEGSRLVYLSLGSLGCMDVPLMQHVIDVLGATEHRVIVSMGPLHEQLTLGERMYGEQFLPQTAIVPQCDVMITHGGNNTVGEAFTFGVPTIVMPLFWDQYDNAQRIDELGLRRSARLLRLRRRGADRARSSVWRATRSCTSAWLRSRASCRPAPARSRPSS